MKKLLLLSFFIFSNVKADSPALISEFKTMITQSKIGSVKEQAFCYLKDGTIQGYQTEKSQRIASITKLLSTLLASETMNLNGHFFTKFYIGKESLHIEGGNDPFFEEDKLLLFFRALNQLGFKTFKTVTFSNTFKFYDIGMSRFEVITPEKTRIRLAAYFSPTKKSFVRAKWQSVRKFALEEGLDLEVTSPIVTSPSVSVSDKNPLINENTIVYQHKSMPFHRLLKTMNVQSKNFVAENVYNIASSYKTFSTLMTEAGIPANSYKIYNGSGLPLINGQKRADNLASCSTVLKIISLLSTSLKKHNLNLSDVVAVNGGKDLGSFRKRFLNQPEIHEAVLAKTGTLKHTSSLGGYLMIDSEIPFAILNHTNSSSSARKFQDRFLSRIFHHLGNATPIEYEKISIFPWDDTPFLVLVK